MRGLLFLIVGMIVGVLLAFGIVGVSGYSSVTIECLTNGSYVVVDDNETGGIIMILVGLFTLALAPLLYCQLKAEHERLSDGL